MRDYLLQMIDSGIPGRQAQDIVSRLIEHGAQEVFWAHAGGGRRGHLACQWDVRVVETKTEAQTAVPDVTGRASRPPGTSPLPDLEHRPEVLHAFRGPVQPAKVKVPRKKRSKLLPSRLRYDFTETAHASLAVGHVGATVNVSDTSTVDAEDALIVLTQIVINDLQ